MTAQTTTDQATKSRVRDAMLAHLRQSGDALGSAADFERRTGQLGHDVATLEPDDLSQSDEAGDLEGLYERSVSHHSQLLDQAERLDFSLTDVVGPGAIVGLDGQRYVVGIVSDAFECDGLSYEGISLDSPIYAHLQGLGVGAEISFAGKQHRIDFVA